MSSSLTLSDVFSRSITVARVRFGDAFVMFRIYDFAMPTGAAMQFPTGVTTTVVGAVVADGVRITTTPTGVSIAPDSPPATTAEVATLLEGAVTAVVAAYAEAMRTTRVTAIVT